MEEIQPANEDQQQPPPQGVLHPVPQLPDATPIFSLEQINSWTNNLTQLIGKGGQGCVYFGRMTDLPNSEWNEHEIAVKVSAMAQANNLAVEAATIAQFNHANIVRLIGVCRTETNFYLVMPFLANGDLLSRFKSFTWNQIINVLRGAALGLSQLHHMDPPVIFRDFKTANILLDEGLNAVICDFGGAGPSDRGGLCVTHGYADPKFVYTQFAKPTQDIYSFGVVLLQLIVQHRGSVMSVHGKYQVIDWAQLECKRKGHAVAKKLLRKGWLRKTGSSGCSKDDARRITLLGLRCVSKIVTERPNIDELIAELQQYKLETGKAQTWKACLGFSS